MDEKLEKALEFSNYQNTLRIQKENLKLRLDHMLITRIENVVIKCDMELINFLQTCIINKCEYAIILDTHKNPIKINKLDVWVSTLLNVYNTAYNEYFDKYEELKKARNVKKVIS